MRLSRGRLLLRAVLLLLGSGWAVWWALRARGRARLLEGAERVFQEKLALAYALVGALAVLAAGAAVLSTRRRPPRQTLGLRGPPDAAAGPAAGEAADDEGGPQ